MCQLGWVSTYVNWTPIGHCGVCLSGTHVKFGQLENCDQYPSGMPVCLGCIRIYVPVMAVASEPYKVEWL